MNESLDLFLTAILGYIFFLIEEFGSNAVASILSILVSSIITILLSIFVFRRTTSFLAFTLVVSVQLFLTSVLRVAFVYGGFITYLKGVDVFGMLGLNIGTYVVFAISGILPAYCIKRLDPGAVFRLYPIVFSSLGVLYAYKFAEGFWSPLGTLDGIILFVAEFTAPTIYALIGIWATITYRKNSDRGRRQELLSQESEAGNTEAVKRLLVEATKADVNTNDFMFGNTPLRYAAREGHIEIVKLLLEAGADVNKAKKRRTVISVIVKRIIEARGDKVVVNKAEKRSDTPLHYAARGGHTEIVKLLKKYGAQE